MFEAGVLMTIYRVMKCNPANVGDWQKVEPESCHEAAEKICGFKLRTKGRPGELRARVRYDGDLSQTSPCNFYAS
jgi:hypothetical protein